MKKILVIGDYCIDKFVYGHASRLSPEAPVPVFTPIEIKTNDGMAGNVATNLMAMSTEYEIELQYQDEHITKTRYIDHNTNHMFLRVDEGEYNIKPLQLDDTVVNRIKEAEAVIVSDYNKGFLSLETINEIGKLAKLSFLDTKKKINSGTIENYTFIKLNEDEFKKNMTDDPKKLKKIIATLGRNGAQYMDKTYPVIAKETIDVSGAGDTFLAAFVINYLQTKDVDIAITFANKMCSIVVSKKGVVTP
jgi:D-beta-D-heptose 7-phosphate kinase/D-beta-D-heptose 1-phosphate adenosyltransferase